MSGDRRILISSNPDYSITEFEYKTDIVDRVVEFVVDCQYKIIELARCEDKDILMCAPNYFLELLNNEHLQRTGISAEDVGGLFFCGLKCQISYENSITVFYNAYLPTQIIKFTQQL